MASTIRGILGLSLLLTVTVGCDDGTDPGPYSTGSGGAGSGGAGSGGAVTLPPGVPLTPANGWVAGGNMAGIEGAMFQYADTTSTVGLTFDFTGGNACIAGTAAKVEMPCTVEPPATDCYGTYWGAAIGLNLAQPIDMTTMMGGTPGPWDATANAVTGFAFVATANNGVAFPTGMRFKVETASTEYCTPAMKTIAPGANVYTFADLVSSCWTTGGMPAPTTGLIKIAWHVVTNATAAVPFDFCISDVRATQ